MPRSMRRAMTRSISRTRLFNCSPIRSSARQWAGMGANEFEKELSWEHEAPHLLKAYDTLFSMENEKHRHVSGGSQSKSAHVGSTLLGRPRNTDR